MEAAMAAKRTPALDRIDVKILAALQRDGRSTIQKLAETVGLSPRASLERVRRLEAAGVIAAYEELTSALIDDANLGVARVVSHVALRPIRRFGGYPTSLLGRQIT